MEKKRTIIIDCLNTIGETVTVKGWVHTVRSHGKIAFFDLRDRSGLLQIGAFGVDLAKQAGGLGSQDVVGVTGVVKERGERYINKELPTGTIELEAKEITIIAKSAEMPFDMGGKELHVDLPTLLDNRALTLRHPKVQAIFKVQEVIIDAFREFMKSQDFFEFQAPSIAPAVAEGGSEVFEIAYFENKAYLTQSPQLYKQIVMTAFERVFSVNKVFRAEPSVTTRHLTEVVSLDAEMGFIDEWTDVRDMAEATVKYIFTQLEKKCQKELALFGASIPSTIEKTPTYSLRDVQEKIFMHSGRDVRGEKDLNPEDEREICAIVKEETGSDLVFVYGYPTKKKPFYVYPDPKDPEYNQGMDLLCRGVEWLSGGRRIHEYQQLLRHVEEWKMDKNKVKMFLDAFKYGAPPEGGFAFGAERITMQILGLTNVREAAMFPRDMERIDERLSKSEEKSKETLKKANVIFAAHPVEKEIPIIAKQNDTLFVLPLISLLIVLLVLLVYNLSIKQQIHQQKVLPAPPSQMVDYPLLKTNPGIELSAETAIVLDDTSKVILFEKNPHLRFSMASTTKIMTALVALEHFQLDDIISVQTTKVEGVNVGFLPGEQVSFEDMLYALLLPSGNDAALALAENYPGGVNAFVAKMNEKAKGLQLNYTHYADSSGLEDDGDYTTVKDLARLTSHALKNDTLAAIVNTKQKTIRSLNYGNEYVLTNLNRLLGQYGVVGVKTGTTEAAGEVLVTAMQEQGRTFIVIVMKSKDRFTDTQKLLQLISNNVQFINPLERIN